MKSNSVAVVSIFASLCYGSPLLTYDAGLAPRQAPGPGSYFAITGATGGVHPRLEIRELEKTGNMWNLFLLALRDFEAMDQNDIGSYYQIAGIHGMPWTEWDGVAGNIEGRKESERGYCPHNNLLFGTWHRPYLALFEQQLQKIAKQIAGNFPASSRSAYEDAANKIRIPFWDWARATSSGQTVLPSALIVPNVQVTFPNGTAGQIPNPLYEYRFHPLDHSQINSTGCSSSCGQNGCAGGSPEVCDNSPMTIRSGNSTSDHEALEYKLNRILPNQRKTLFSILSQWQHFNTFSNDGSCSAGHGRVVGSLEVLHNPIHVNNWPGHMSPASVSAFDPMFWLHHANVDRQMALHQALYPDTYIEQCVSVTPTYTIETGTMLNKDSPLTPFHKNAAGDWWTSANSRYITAMNYTYPELANNPSNSTLVASIKAQYSDAATTNAKIKREDEDPAPTKGRAYLAEVTLPVFGFSDDKGFSQPYNVFTFVGDVPSDPKEWMASKSFVAITSTIGGKNMDSDQSTTIVVDLTEALVKNGKTSGEASADYLKENLHWRLGLGDFEITREEIKGVEVNLISTEVEFSNRDDVFDRWVGEYTRYGLVDV